MAILLSACGDDDSTTELLAPAPGGDALAHAAGDEIRDRIEALFPGPGLRNAALRQFRNVERQLERGDVEDASEKAVELVGFTLDRLANDQLLDPGGAVDGALELAVAELAAALYAFVGLAAPPAVQVFTPEGDVVAVVGPSGGTVTTEDEFAGVDVPDEATDETSVITIERLDQEPCLPTGLPQFEGCYRFDKVPATDFLQEVVTGVCIDPAVTGSTRHRLLLHKFDPDEPGEGVVPLENVAAPFLDCSDFTVAAADAPWPARLARAGWNRVTNWLAPPLHAADNGGGGMTISFSDFGWVLPPELAFNANTDGDQDIYISNPTGHGFINLTPDALGPAADVNPKWSRDASQIAFGSGRDGDIFEIYVMGADGSGVTRITNSPGHDLAHSWAPNDSYFAITSDRSGSRDIYYLDADGNGNAFPLAQQAGSPDISPDGQTVVYEGNVPSNGGVTLDILTVDSAGNVVTRIGNDPVLGFRPTWSPDGTRIAFASLRDGNAEIYVMNADGSNQTRVTNHPLDDREPVWSPDGSMIAFQARGQDTDGDEFGLLDRSAIFVINVDGTGLTRITTPAALFQHPHWKPAP